MRSERPSDMPVHIFKLAGTRIDSSPVPIIIIVMQELSMHFILFGIELGSMSYYVISYAADLNAYINQSLEL